MAKRGKKVGNPSIVDTQRQGITSTNRGNEYAAGNTQGRKVAGTSGYSKVDDVSARDFSYGLTARKTSRSDAADNAGSATHRGNVPQDRLGPRFAVQAKLPGPVAPEASLTQGNLHTLPPAINRSNVNFNYGRQA
jgi:hypothetical protein